MLEQDDEEEAKPASKGVHIASVPMEESSEEDESDAEVRAPVALVNICCAS